MKPTESLSDRLDWIVEMLDILGDEIVEHRDILAKLDTNEGEEVARRTLLHTVGLMQGRMKSLLEMLGRVEVEEIYENGD